MSAAVELKYDMTRRYVSESRDSWNSPECHACSCRQPVSLQGISLRTAHPDCPASPSHPGLVMRRVMTVVVEQVLLLGRAPSPNPLWCIVTHPTGTWSMTSCGTNTLLNHSQISTISKQKCSYCRLWHRLKLNCTYAFHCLSRTKVYSHTSQSINGCYWLWHEQHLCTNTSKPVCALTGDVLQSYASGSLKDKTWQRWYDITIP